MQTYPGELRNSKLALLTLKIHLSAIQGVTFTVLAKLFKERTFNNIIRDKLVTKMDSAELTQLQINAIRSCVSSLRLDPTPIYMPQWLFGRMDDYYKACLGTRKPYMSAEEVKMYKNSFNALAAHVSAFIRLTNIDSSKKAHADDDTTAGRRAQRDNFHAGNKD